MSSTKVDRSTRNQYEENPVSFFEKKMKEADSEAMKKYWESQMNTEIEMSENNSELDDALSQHRKSLKKGEELVKALRKGPDWNEKLIWKIDDTKKNISSSLKGWSSFFWKYVVWMTYPAVIGVLVLNVAYCINYGLGMQGVFISLITGYGINWMIIFRDKNKNTWHTTFALMLVVINLLLVQVVSLAPAPNATTANTTRTIETENYGVVMDKETNEVTRVVDGNNWFIPAFQWNETVMWYGDNFSSDYDPISLNIHPGDVTITAIPRLIPTVQPGDELNNLSGPVEIFNDVENQSHENVANFLEESKGDIATREGLMQIKNLIESTENPIYQVKISELTIITRRDDGAQTSISYSDDELE